MSADPDLAADLAGFASVPDYIYGITRAIWEDRGVGAGLDAYYAPDVVVRAPTGVTVGNDGVVSQTLQTLHQFPDRLLVGEDVIWTATPGSGFLSSHRLTSVMTHSGDGALGAARGARVRARVIADCWVRGGQVTEEWLVRDQAAFAVALGASPRALARSMAVTGRGAATYDPALDPAPRYAPAVADDPAVAVLCAGLSAVWGGKRLSAIRDLYFDGAALHAPGGEVRYGHADIDRWFVGYLASFPDAVFTVHSATVNRDAEQPVRIAVRWSLSGSHAGYGQFGPPTGAPVHVMGISHVHMTEGRVRTEWTVTDEVAIWSQIFAHAPDLAGDA